jgi:hypothetical protein
MARKKAHTPEEIVAKLRQVEVLIGQGKSVAVAVRSIGVTEPSCYRWWSEYGGLKVDQVKRQRADHLTGEMRHRGGARLVTASLAAVLHIPPAILMNNPG